MDEKGIEDLLEHLGELTKWTFKDSNMLLASPLQARRTNASLLQDLAQAKHVDMGRTLHYTITLPSHGSDENPADLDSAELCREALPTIQQLSRLSKRASHVALARKLGSFQSAGIGFMAEGRWWDFENYTGKQDFCKLENDIKTSVFTLISENADRAGLTQMQKLKLLWPDVPEQQLYAKEGLHSFIWRWPGTVSDLVRLGLLEKEEDAWYVTKKTSYRAFAGFRIRAFPVMACRLSDLMAGKIKMEDYEPGLTLEVFLGRLPAVQRALRWHGDPVFQLYQVSVKTISRSSGFEGR